MIQFSSLKNNQYLLYCVSFFFIFFLCIISFSIFKTFDNKCVQGNCLNGHGVYLFASGFKYEGEWKNGKKHGQGILTYPDGSAYKGGWGNNRMHGRGDKIYTGSIVIRYVGEWKHGHKHGKGTQLFRSGSKYVGEWKRGQRHGNGILTTTYGLQYDGKWKDTYDGQWKNGEMHGRGTQTFNDGRTFMGTWDQHKKHGIGTTTYPDGTKIEEKWVHGKLFGSPLFYYYEFDVTYDIKKLCTALKKDISISLTARENTVKWLNELLQLPDLYDKLLKKTQSTGITPEITALLEKSREFRDNSVSDMSIDMQFIIRKLNRLLLEHIYPDITPKVLME